MDTCGKCNWFLLYENEERGEGLGICRAHTYLGERIEGGSELFVRYGETHEAQVGCYRFRDTPKGTIKKWHREQSKPAQTA